MTIASEVFSYHSWFKNPLEQFHSSGNVDTIAMEERDQTCPNYNVAISSVSKSHANLATFPTEYNMHPLSFSFYT